MKIANRKESSPPILDKLMFTLWESSFKIKIIVYIFQISDYTVPLEEHLIFEKCISWG